MKNQTWLSSWTATKDFKQLGSKDCVRFVHLFPSEPSTVLGQSSVQFSSVTQSYLTLCNPVIHSTPGLPVHHQLLEFTQTHAHWVCDAIQPSSSAVPFSSCPQSLPASGSFPMSQLFTWGSQSPGVSASAWVLPMNTQDWSPLGWTGWISLQSKGLSRVFSNTTVQKHQFFGTQLSSQSNSHIHTWPLDRVGVTKSLLKAQLSLGVTQIALPAEKSLDLSLY